MWDLGKKQIGRVRIRPNPTDLSPAQKCRTKTIGTGLNKLSNQKTYKNYFFPNFFANLASTPAPTNEKPKTVKSDSAPVLGNSVGSPSP